jgi:hypothetical protein
MSTILGGSSQPYHEYILFLAFHELHVHRPTNYKLLLELHQSKRTTKKDCFVQKFHREKETLQQKKVLGALPYYTE